RHDIISNYSSLLPILRPPPISTLFPYTTLFRSGFGPHPESEHPGQTRLECRSRTAISCDSRERREQHFRRPAEMLLASLAAITRSEEHTSELQSRGHLVCRLLLEKKKNNIVRQS